MHLRPFEAVFILFLANFTTALTFNLGRVSDCDSEVFPMICDLNTIVNFNSGNSDSVELLVSVFFRKKPRILPSTESFLKS